MAAVTDFTPNFKAAYDFISTLRGTRDRSYGQNLIAYYRDYGKRPVSAPDSYGVSNAQYLRISHMIRHLLVGDCDKNGSAIDPITGKRL